MGIRLSHYYEPKNGMKVYACSKCRTHLATPSMVISKEYCGSMGRAYLMSNISNIVLSSKVDEEEMRTGAYLIRRIYCHQCHQNIGWKYLKADEKRNLYKQGTYIMELSQIMHSV